MQFSDVATSTNGSVAMPDVEEFGQRVSPTAPRQRALKQLHALLVAMDSTTALPERVDQLEVLAKWIRASGKVSGIAASQPGDRPQIVRLRALVLALEAFAEMRRRLAALVRTVIADSNGVILLARLGLPNDRGFWNETIDRLSRRFLPEPVDERDLSQTMHRLFPSERDAAWLSVVPPDVVERFAASLGSFPNEPSAWSPLFEKMFDSLSLMTTRVSAVGLTDVIRVRSPVVSLRDSAFFRLPRAYDALIAAVRAPAEHDLDARAQYCRSLIEECRGTTAVVVQNLEQFGVSIDVVYRIELIEKNLDRVAMLTDLLARRDAEPVSDDARYLIVDLILARVKDRDIGEIARNNLHLMARKIIERAGDTGEHYITSSRGEYAKMLVSAGGGGVLTAGTTAMKYLVVWGHFAPFVEGMLSAANYAGSFVLMQLLGFTLATKQPSMTAAALAGSMRESAGYTDLTGLVTTTARITRSQLAAAIGNVGLVIPAAFALDYVTQIKTGHHFLDEETAEHVVQSLHPLESGTIFFAALTGVLLWLSSVGAGWLENWAVYRRLPEAIAEHRIRRFIGARLPRWFSRVFAHNISGIGGNTSLGLLLGMTPVMGKFFGLPLDVRHVTLSTGALTLAGCTLGHEAIRTPAYIAAIAGIAVIGTLNFGVSFVLALAVALRARGVETKARFKLLASVAITFVRSPFQFFLPPGGDVVPEVHGPVSVPPPRLSRHSLRPSRHSH